MRGVALAGAASLLMTSSLAVAEERISCGRSGQPGVVMRGESIEPALRARIAEQLRSALSVRKMELCVEPSSDAIAELDISGLSGASPEAVVMTLSVRDEVTDKRVSRDIDLRDIPEDGRPLVIAQAADELLRASWAELLVVDAPKPRRPVPPEVTQAVPPPEPVVMRGSVRRAPLVEVGAAAALEYFTSGHTQLGPDVSLGVFPWSRLGAMTRAGLRSASGASADAGSLDVRSAVLAMSVVAAALPREGRAGIDAGAELFVTHVSYEAQPRPGSRGMSDGATAAHVSAVVRGWAVLADPLRANVGLLIGAPIHGVRAVADDSTISGVSGLLLGAHLGIGAGW